MSKKYSLLYFQLYLAKTEPRSNRTVSLQQKLLVFFQIRAEEQPKHLP